MAEYLFWISIAALVYTYIGYPVVIWMLACLRNRGVAKASITPRVSVVLPCHNEEANVEARIRNLLASDYPPELLEIIIVSDGSTDLTARRASRYREDRVRVLEYDERRGKASALNLGVENASGEIIVFADARQRFESDAIKELAADFADPSVGAASGQYILDRTEGTSVGESVGLYWKYEEWIRKSEARFDSVIGATGAIYAIRRSLWKPLPAATILDDVYTPMQIALSGHRVVFDEKARATDRAADSTSREFSRKVRTLTGNYQLCQLMPRLLVPSYSLFFQFYSHKLMRLVAPLFFLLLLAANLFIAAQSVGASEQIFYKAFLAGQIVFYASVMAGGLLLRRNRRVRLLNVAYVFSVMNAAALVGLVYFILGKRNVWSVIRGQGIQKG
ncbi:MAG: glycosyltransferase family 2 protein [Blastocatellia bacterium]|nr:glycosyltransferase family 2 protein [Blastocatellia bacterium]